MSQQKSEKPVCFHCGSDSDRVPLFRILIRNVQKWVCARCVPIVIHGEA